MSHGSEIGVKKIKTKTVALIFSFIRTIKAAGNWRTKSFTETPAFLKNFNNSRREKGNVIELA